MPLTAMDIVGRLKALPATKNTAGNDDADFQKLGVRMKLNFDLAKEAIDTELGEVNALLEEPYYEARLVAVSILDFKARRKGITDSQRKSLYDCYIDNHDRINDWGMVDRAAPHVVGGYLIDRSRKPLWKLAKSRDVWRRRTAITAPLYFIKFGHPSDLDDVFALAELLVDDDSDFVNNAVGIALKHAGTVDQKALVRFLDDHADHLSPATRRYAIEKLPPNVKKRYQVS